MRRTGRRCGNLGTMMGKQQTLMHKLKKKKKIGVNSCMRSLGHMITPIIKHAADTVNSSFTRKHLQRCAAVRFHRSNLVKKIEPMKLNHTD